MEVAIDFPVINTSCKTVVCKRYVDYGSMASSTAKSGSVANINTLQIVGDEKVFN